MSIGTSPTRKDAVEKATGQGIFVADLKIPGMLHLAVVRAAKAHAVIEDIDTAAALSCPGVVTVVFTIPARSKSRPKPSTERKLMWWGGEI